MTSVLANGTELCPVLDEDEDVESGRVLLSEGLPSPQAKNLHPVEALEQE
jgi:hypothetical protein